MKNSDIFQIKINDICYYLNEKVFLLRFFEEIHMVKIKYVNSEKKQIVDISGITRVLVSDVLIPINLLGGGRK